MLPVRVKSNAPPACREAKMSPAAVTGPDPDLVAALRKRSFYPGASAPVELRETHASCVFLVGDDVYKLKKPVNFGFLDYSTLARRRRMCHREVELNRRLAPDVYLGVLPITGGPDGPRLGGRGAAIDYVVHMRRLPDDRTLHELVRRDQACESDVRAVARRIAAFHANAGRGPRIDAFGSPAAISSNHEENFRQVAPFVGSALSRESYELVTAFVRDFLSGHRQVLLDRVRHGLIRDGHGDLRTEHVYLMNTIEIIDCIEFNQRFRYADTAADLAFLAMDLDALGAPDLSRTLIDEYQRVSGEGFETVLDFYLCYRAFTRGKVACLRSVQAGQGSSAHLAEATEARRFFHLASRYARHDRRPVVVVMAGPTATGKSTLAGALGDTLAARVVSADEVRKTLAGLSIVDHRDDAIDAGLYAPDVNRRVYAEMAAEAPRTLARGRSVVLDATHRRRANRDAVRSLAAAAGARFLVVECVAPDDAVRERIDKRRASGQSWSDGRWEVYMDQRQRFEPLIAAEGDSVRVDTTAPLEQQLDRVLSGIQCRSG